MPSRPGPVPSLDLLNCKVVKRGGTECLAGVAMSLKNNFAEVLKNTRGSVGVIGAISLVPLCLAASAAVEFSVLAYQREILRAATDTAVSDIALDVKQNLNSVQTSAKMTEALNLLQASTRDPNVEAKLTKTEASAICLEARRNVPTTLGSVLGYSYVNISTTSCVKPKNLLEIALVLDNTGSMARAGSDGMSKMDALKKAATDLIGVLNPDTANPDAVVSVVPFSGAVNVGTSNASQPWMDTQGASSIHWENFTSPGTSWGPMSRFDVFARMKASWGGCVEERPFPYTTTDDSPTSSKPDTLFVPALAPDEAGEATGTAYYKMTPSAQYPAQTYSGYYWSFNSYLNDNAGACTANDASAIADASDPVSAGSGAKKMCKYNGQAVANVSSGVGGVNGGSGAFPAGPNFGCTSAPLQTLTADMSKITGSTGAISKMTPNGATNLLAGFMWGWRTLSPKGPFASTGSTDGPVDRKPIAYGGNSTKVIVLMTDGFNQWSANPYSPFRSIYSSLGYMANSRLASYASNYRGVDSSGPTDGNNYRAQMDAALLDACQNAKKAGVIIFTVGFSTSSDPIDEQGIALLKACATKSNYYYSADSQISLKTAFEFIARNISKQRLTM